MNNAALKTPETQSSGVKLTKKGREAITQEAMAGPDSVSGKRLKSLIERVERLETEKSGLAEDIKEVYSEAKGTGFDVAIIRKVIRLRKMEIEKRREADELTALYMAAIGME